MEKFPNLLLSFYGDDFTGSADSMEALTVNGIKTVLFLQVPDAPLLKERFPNIQAFGVAGVSRTMSPEEMEEELLPILKQLQTFRTPIVHYKICSTFDSSPQVGSIGKVIDLGSELFPHQESIPLLVGAPILKRYTVFGNHFATVGEETYRLDRHPTMSKHPVTPMNEGDLRKHLSQQTKKPVHLVSVLDLDQDREFLIQRYHERAKKGGVVLFDVIHDGHMGKIGMILWEQRKGPSQFVVGSSGVEYALAQYWNESGMAGGKNLPHFHANPVDQLLVVSGSCSPVTKEQIEWALENGFAGIKIPAEDLVHPLYQQKIVQETLERAVHLLRSGESVVIYTSLGPDDPSIPKTKETLESLGEKPSNTGKIVGQQLGRLLKELVTKTGIRRAVIAGGDTSGYAAKELGIYGLEMILPIVPGGPLCRCYSEDPAFDGLELALKGGQVGKADYFGLVRSGNLNTRPK